MDEIRELLNQPGRGVNDAVTYYAERNPDVPYSIRSEPILYGELARAALIWTGDLLGAVEQAARQRPAAEGPVRALTDAVSGYFGATTRWPEIPHLRDPLRLLVPAYYAVRAVQLLGHHVQPPLVSVDYDDAHDFMEEVLGRGPAMTIREHKNADLATMRKVTEQDAGHEPIMFRWLLSGRQRARLQKARAAPPPARQQMPAPTEPSPGGHATAGATEDSPAPSPEGELVLAALWTRRLGGTRITLRSESSYDSDYSGGSSHYSAQTFLDLFDSGRYRLRDSVTTRASSGGLSIGGDPRVSEAWGAWIVTATGESVQLRLEDDSGSVTLHAIGGAGGGEIVIDGEARTWTSL